VSILHTLTKTVSLFLTSHKNQRIALLIVLIFFCIRLSFFNADPLLAFQEQIVTVDDSVIGKDLLQFNYVGSHWKHCTNCAQSAGVYGDSNSWNATRNEYVTIRFDGTRIRIYGVRGPSTQPLIDS
jgi:hypothetical protein